MQDIRGHPLNEPSQQEENNIGDEDEEDVLVLDPDAEAAAQGINATEEEPSQKRKRMSKRVCAGLPVLCTSPDAVSNHHLSLQGLSARPIVLFSIPRESAADETVQLLSI